VNALLLAAGLGTRLRPLTDRLPKCLVPVHGRPLLGYWLDMLLGNGIAHVVVNTHYLPAQVEAFVGASRWAPQVTLSPEPELLGTGGTVLANAERLGPGAFMVAHADNLCRFDVRAFVAAHRSRPAGCEITMMTFATDTPRSCGIVELDGQGRVVAFHEKVESPPGNLANGAVYLLEPAVVAFLRSTGRTVIDLSTEVIPHFLGRIATFENRDYLRDIGTPEALARAHAEFTPDN
jgi:mannose-1-phosphate guanylyltransferase